MSEFIAITLHGQFIVLYGVRNSLHGVNEFSVRSKSVQVFALYLLLGEVFTAAE